MPILRLISLKSWHIYVEMSVGVACHISESSMASEHGKQNIEKNGFFLLHHQHLAK